jgi:hypothetical protein
MCRAVRAGFLHLPAPTATRAKVTSAPLGVSVQRASVKQGNNRLARYGMAWEGKWGRQSVRYTIGTGMWSGATLSG